MVYLIFLLLLGCGWILVYQTWSKLLLLGMGVRAPIKRFVGKVVATWSVVVGAVILFQGLYPTNIRGPAVWVGLAIATVVGVSTIAYRLSPLFRKQPVQL